MHKRFAPKVNQFYYHSYYWSLLVDKDLKNIQRGFTGVRLKDHGPKDGTCLEIWIRGILQAHDLNHKVASVRLICMPRIFGYVFNPVSFWLCYDEMGQVIAVLNEVNNTFGETHLYLCCHPDHRPIESKDILVTDKQFHVSPFLPREGTYKFRFDIKQKSLGIWIDYYNANGKKILITSICGDYHEFTLRNIGYFFFRYPLVTFKVVMLIYFQAMKLAKKGIGYIKKPIPKKDIMTKSKDS